MKHIKNSIKDGLFLLEHSGIPIAILTDFNENISNGSLCVDKTNQDLYILKGGAWVKYGSGFDGDTYIPLAGTKLNKPVTGNIEFMSGKKLYSGETSINLTNTRLILGFSDNNNTTSNFSYIYDKNVILLKNDSIITIDSNSKNNFIDRVSTNTSTGLILNDSSNNYILSEIKKPLNITQSSYSYIKGNFNDLNASYNSHLNLYINEGYGIIGTNINFNTNTDYNISTFVIPTQPILLEYNNNSKFRINNIGNKLTSNNNYDNYIEGTIKDFEFTFNNYISLYGNVEKTTFNNNSHIYNLGHITNDEGAILFSNNTTTSSNIENTYGVYNIGMLGAISIIDSTNTLFLGRNINNSIISNSDDIFINTNGVETINNSFNNISINTTNRDFISSSIYSTIDDSSCNILFNNNIINMNSANNNFVVNVENVNMNGNNNFIFTPKYYSTAFTGTVNGDNNVIFSLDADKNYTIDSNIFTFGTIYSTSGGLSIPSGNILLGNYEFNDTLTTNNIMLGAKLLTNINHGNQINNIFLNVDNFIAPDSNTVYLPNKFYSMNGSYFGLFNMGNISNNRIWNMPDNSGTVALLSDISSVSLVELNDVNINSPINGDILTYNTVSGKWENGKDIIDVSYNTLYGLYSSSGLIAGKYYRFDYQTIHKIPYTTVINTAPIEQLIVQAISSNKLDKVAHSPSFPYDIIYYRIDDTIINIANDSTYFVTHPFGEPYLNIETQTSNVDTIPVPGLSGQRTGRIYYREDTIKRLSAPYDFRNVKFRRWKFVYPYSVAAITYTYTNTTYYYGDIIVHSGIIYMAKNTFNCVVGTTMLDNQDYFLNITNILDGIANKDEPSYIPNPIRNKYISPTPDNFVLIDNTGSNDLILQVDNASYFDFTTFDNDLVGVDTKSRNIESFNCHIENFVPAWLEQVSWEYYPNIVFADYSNNVKVGQFSENITIQDSCNITIGSYCKQILINSLTANLCQTILGDRNQNMILDNKYGYSNTSETYFKIGTSNKNFLVSNCYNVEFGNGNNILYSIGVKESRIGNLNNSIYILGSNTDNNLTNCYIGDSNSFINLNLNNYKNIIGNNNTNITIPQYSYSNTIGNNNNFINGVLTNISNIEGTFINNFNGNTIGDNNNNITLAGSNNIVENNVANIFCNNSVAFNNITFKSNSGNLSFINGSNTAFEGTIFDYNRSIFVSQKTLDISSNISPDILNKMNYNIVKRSDSTIYSQEVNTYTNSTTYTINTYKLILT
jgi:hypothetical protein